MSLSLADLFGADQIRDIAALSSASFLYVNESVDWKTDRTSRTLVHVDASGAETLVDAGLNSASIVVAQNGDVFFVKNGAKGASVCKYVIEDNSVRELIALPAMHLQLGWLEATNALIVLYAPDPSRMVLPKRNLKALRPHAPPAVQTGIMSICGDTGEVQSKAVYPDREQGSPLRIVCHPVENRIAATWSKSADFDDIVRSKSICLWENGLEQPPRLIETDLFLEDVAFASNSGADMLVIGAKDRHGGPIANASVWLVSGNQLIAKRIIHDHDFAVQNLKTPAGHDRIFCLVQCGTNNQIIAFSAEPNSKHEIVRNEAETIDAFDVGPDGLSCIIAIRTSRSGAAISISDTQDVGSSKLHKAATQHSSSEECVVEWTGQDGTKIEGLLRLPEGWEQAQGRLPCITYLHGGPHDSARPCLGNDFDYGGGLVEHGFAVFRPNYRGSCGYGDEFYGSVLNSYFDQMSEDVMSGLDSLIEAGFVDGSKLGLMGYSAGGALTKRLIGQTNRFKAASAGAGASCWWTMYLSGDLRLPREHWFAGQPDFTNLGSSEYQLQSPIGLVDKVQTPTLLFYGQNDERNPASEGVLFHKALKLKGIATELYTAPASGHLGWKKTQLLEKANLEIEWFKRWILKTEHDWETPPLGSAPS